MMPKKVIFRGVEQRIRFNRALGAEEANFVVGM
jgi:hypothetical protein